MQLGDSMSENTENSTAQNKMTQNQSEEQEKNWKKQNGCDKMRTFSETSIE